MTKITTETFIAKARAVHGDTYDYSMVNYVYCKTPVTIKCKVCGNVFQQRPFVHLQGSGCQKCGRKKAAAPMLTQEEFVRRAKEKNGDRYDYSESVYVGWDKLIQIRCKKHDILFTMKAGNHICGSEGCPKCLEKKVSIANTKTREKFIEQARRRHGDKYNYDKVDYKSTFEKVTITCPKHGDFEQTPQAHLGGYGCYWCGRESQGKKMSSNTEEFVRRATEVHQGRYDYSKTVYRGSNMKLTITCPIHGDFVQTANIHLCGHGCPECGSDEWLTKVTATKDDFIRKAREIHGDKYDYSLVDYKAQSKKVKIICPKHGVFEMKAHSHLHWQGCPKCARSLGEERIAKYLKANNIDYKWHHRVPYKKPPMKSHFEVDFFLPDFNLFIEYNGKQHYANIDHWNHDNPLSHRQARDAALRDYCKEHDRNLLEIHYKDFDRIEEILEKELL